MRSQLHARAADGGLHGGGLLRGLCLARQRPELFAQLVGQVVQAVKVGLHVDELALRLFFSTPMLQHTSGLLDEGAALLGAGFQDLR